MRYDQLEHAIRAACEVAGDSELLIFGSQAILGSFPDAPQALRGSMEIDVQAKNRPERTDLIDGSLGEDSLFHTTHGFYVHGISIEAAVLPEGWVERTVAVSHATRTKGGTGLCLEAHDLAASKLVAHREKDRVFVSTLLTEGLIDDQVLRERIRTLPVERPVRDRLIRWVDITVEEVASG